MGHVRINNKQLRTAGTVLILNAYGLFITGPFYENNIYKLRKQSRIVRRKNAKFDLESLFK